MIAFFNGRRTGTVLGRRRAMGLALGTVGLVLLASATFAAVPHRYHLVVMVLASLSWSNRLDLRPRLGPATRLLDGQPPARCLPEIARDDGLASVGGAGPADIHAVSARSMFAWGTSRCVGSLIRYPVFQWLLGGGRTPPQWRCYTYVQPDISPDPGHCVRGVSR